MLYSIPSNQRQMRQINGMNAIKAFPVWHLSKSTPNTRMVFGGYECLLAFPGLYDFPDYEFGIPVFLFKGWIWQDTETPPYNVRVPVNGKSWLRQIMIEHLKKANRNKNVCDKI